MNTHVILFFLGMFSLMIYSFFFSSFIAFLVIGLYTVLVFLLHIGKESFLNKKILLLLLFVSSCIIVTVKALALKDIFLINYRVNNTLEHINLIFGLSIISYIFCRNYVSGKVETFSITFLGAFGLSVLLELAQYFYREYYNLVTRKSHGLYNDSMIDLAVNFGAAFIISCILLLFFSYQNDESYRK